MTTAVGPPHRSSAGVSSSTSSAGAAADASLINGRHSFLGSYFQSQEAWTGVRDAFSAMAGQPESVASAGSSATAVTQQNGAEGGRSTPAPATAAARRRPPRGQYPADSAETHVEFILVASFDIDRGSIMEFQYPSSISGDEPMLAEQMLPDQVHNRSQDWTVFFLHKPAEADEEGLDAAQTTARIEERRRRRRLRREQLEAGGERGGGDDDDEASGAGDEDEDEDALAEEEDEKAVDGPPLIYVLNLVNTKHDDTVRRGAIVKAMAICTRHPFLHIYKPLLLLALDTYFKSPTIDTLADLYESLNNMDLSLMPRLSLMERHILQATTVKDMFVERFQQMNRQRQIENGDAQQASQRSADDKAVAVPSFTIPRDTHEFETKVYYNGISVPIKVPTARSPETVGDFSIIKLIQTFSTPHEKSPQPFSLHPHLTTDGANTHPIIVLVNALLTQKRVIFLGHNMPSGDVADAVLAACALVSGGILRGFARHAFPYTDLTKVDELIKVPGYVAGVTNPTFLNKSEWWDLLCDLPTGRMKISPQIAQPQPTKGFEAFQQQNPTLVTPANVLALQSQDATGDQAFMANVLFNITSHLGEGVIRSMWREWVLRLIRISAAFEECVYGVSALHIGGQSADEGRFGVRGHGYVWPDEASRLREMAGNLTRIEGWRTTRSYYALIQDLALVYESRPVAGIDLHHQHDKLRTLKLSRDESAAIYLALEKAVRTPAEVSQLLTVTPEWHGGLFYISLGLLHPLREVRVGTVALLERVRDHEAGRHFWAKLGRFTKTAFARIEREMAAEEGGQRQQQQRRQDQGQGQGRSALARGAYATDDDDEDGSLLSKTTTLLEQASLHGG